MATSVKLEVLRAVVTGLGAVFPNLTTGREIYLSPKIMSVPGMAPMEIQVCEGASKYENIDGGCRSEDCIISIGLFRKYRLDSGGRHAKALTDLHLSIFQLKEQVVDAFDDNFLSDLLTRPLIIKAESTVTDVSADQLLKRLDFLAGLNSSITPGGGL